MHNETQAAGQTTAQPGASPCCALAGGWDAREGTWTARGLSADFRKSRPHPHAPGWHQVETVTGTHWAHESELRFNAHPNKQ